MSMNSVVQGAVVQASSSKRPSMMGALAVRGQAMEWGCHGVVGCSKAWAVERISSREMDVRSGRKVGLRGSGRDGV